MFRARDFSQHLFNESDRSALPPVWTTRLAQVQRTVNGGAAADDMSSAIGKVGGALVFDGTHDYINCGDNENLNIGSGSYSVAMWFKGLATNYRRLFSRFADESGGHNECFEICSSNTDSKIRWRLDDGSTLIAVTQPEVVFDDGWHHLVWAYCKKSQPNFKML